MRIIVAITGASGVIIGLRLLEELAATDFSVFVIITDNAEHVMKHELGVDYQLPQTITYFKENDPQAPFNSSSFLIDAMVICPCSMKTLAAIAAGYSHNLVTRTAENVLRTKSTLIMVPRETPLSASALDNMLKLNRQGGIILPPVVAYYHKPQSIDDITNFFVGKILDLLRIPNNLYNRWENQ